MDRIDFLHFVDDKQFPLLANAFGEFGIALKPCQISDCTVLKSRNRRALK